MFRSLYPTLFAGDWICNKTVETIFPHLRAKVYRV